MPRRRRIGSSRLGRSWLSWRLRSWCTRRPRARWSRTRASWPGPSRRRWLRSRPGRSARVGRGRCSRSRARCRPRWWVRSRRPRSRRVRVRRRPRSGAGSAGSGSGCILNRSPSGGSAPVSSGGCAWSPRRTAWPGSPTTRRRHPLDLTRRREHHTSPANPFTPDRPPDASPTRPELPDEPPWARPTRRDRDAAA